MPATTYNKVPAHDQQQPEPEGQGQRNDDEDESHDHDEQLTTYTPQPLVGDPNQDLQLQPEKLTDSAAAGDLVLSVDDAIERLGMGRFQLIVLIVAGLCFSADAMQVLQLTFLSEIFRSKWNLTDDETALILSILFIGAIFGTLSLGPLADKKGRKPVFLLASSIISFFGVGVAMVNSYWALLANLFMVGWGIGGLTVPFDILAELLPNASRGKNLLVIQYFWTIGVLLVVCTAFYTLGDGQGSSNWRLFVITCSVPCWLSVIIGYFIVPESPRWLCSQGRCEEAIEILRYAAKTNGHDADLLFPEGSQLHQEEEESSDFCELFSKRWRWTTINLWGAWAFFAFGYYGTLEATTDIFDSQGVAENANGFDYGAIFVSSSAELVGTTVAIFTVDVVGRISLQMVAYAMAGIFVFSLYLSAFYDCHRTVLIAFGFGARIFEMAGSCVSWVSAAEILTTEVRTTGHSAANAVARIGALFSPFIIQGHSSLLKKGMIMLLVHSLTIAFVSQLPETKGSRLGSSQDETYEREDDSDDSRFRDEEVDDE